MRRVLLTALLMAFSLTLTAGCMDGPIETTMPKEEIMKKRKMPVPKGVRK